VYEAKGALCWAWLLLLCRGSYASAAWPAATRSTPSRAAGRAAHSRDALLSEPSELSERESVAIGRGVVLHSSHAIAALQQNQFY